MEASEPSKSQSKPSSTEPPSKRALQLRDAQRAHRERKAQHLKDLEAQVQQMAVQTKQIDQLKEKVKALEFELNLVRASVSACPSCSQVAITLPLPLPPLTEVQVPTPPFNQQELLDTLDDILGTPSNQSTLTATPTQQLQPQPPTAPFPIVGDLLDFPMEDLDTFLNGIVPRMLTSEELYGPFEVDTARLLIQTIPSLKNCADANRLFDLLVEHSQTTDLAKTKTILLGIIRAVTGVLKQVTEEDRGAWFELVSVTQERNLHHFRYITQFWGTALPPVAPFEIDPMNPAHQLILMYKPLFLRIPSLVAVPHEVDEFLFAWARALEHQESQSFFRVNICVSKMVLLCSVKDRAAFFSLFVEMRGENGREVDALLRKLEATSLE
ncbi:hypothetical protein BCR33DRAFT_719641 [Rhizoclosmatium globosum]|uniref:BZIP domain-containing protein n=1 Tax=Rhizoclosmatium globosum TaxID=329046 RepID=A0A1Y2BYK7_9FUNG|nr:hypothetical protein BCR33DRAFT_719641 [Rhizoclosmatium globosum]|eukprot:ORY39816.1 hypothetical protein BCR33DRAFT_719641 [Rhizoclosmatium globosum]